MNALLSQRGPLMVAVLVSIVAVAVAFNPVPHTGGDNAGYIALAHGLLVDGTYTDVFDPERLPHTKYPPVFPLLLTGLIALGARTWVALKMTAAVPTVLAVAFTYLLGARSVGRLGGLAVAVLVALSSGVLYYSHWVLSDPLFLALTVGSLYALSRADVRSARSGGVGRAPTAQAAQEREILIEAERAAVSLQARRRWGWLALGVVGAGLAYFTRSAGLPLIVSLLLWLAIRRRWGALVVSAVSLGVPMALWWMRGRGAGVAQYATEFWMVDPYQPRLGTIGPLGLVGRAVENASAYLLTHGPAGVVGSDGPALAWIGVALALVATVGWVVRVRRLIGPVEIFFPLYTGLILLWPVVWGGDRFALPLYPLVFLYGAVTVQTVADRFKGVLASAVPAVALLIVLLPAGADWIEASRQSRVCGGLAERNGVWACYGPRIGAFTVAAAWTATGLPDGSAVLSRKPRHFYLLSGHPSRAFAFEESAEAHLGLADDLGARYILLDQWDGLAGRYVAAAVRERTGSFCFVRGFGSAQEGGAQLLGVLPPAARGSGPGGGLTACPAGYVTNVEPADYPLSGRIPLLEGLDS